MEQERKLVVSTSPHIKDKDNVNKMIELSKKGPKHSKIEKVEEKEERFQDFKTFKVLHI